VRPKLQVGEQVRVKATGFIGTVIKIYTGGSERYYVSDALPGAELYDKVDEFFNARDLERVPTN